MVKSQHDPMREFSRLAPSPLALYFYINKTQFPSHLSRSASTVPPPAIERISFVRYQIRFRPSVIASRLPCLSETAVLKPKATVLKNVGVLHYYSSLAGDAWAI